MGNTTSVKREKALLVRKGDDTFIPIPSEWVETLRLGFEFYIWSDIDNEAHLCPEHPGEFIPYLDYIEFKVDVERVFLKKLDGGFYVQVPNYVMDALNFPDENTLVLELYENSEVIHLY